MLNVGHVTTWFTWSCLTSCNSRVLSTPRSSSVANSTKRGLCCRGSACISSASAAPVLFAVTKPSRSGTLRCEMAVAMQSIASACFAFSSKPKRSSIDHSRRSNIANAASQFKPRASGPEKKSSSCRATRSGRKLFAVGHSTRQSAQISDVSKNLQMLVCSGVVARLRVCSVRVARVEVDLPLSSKQTDRPDPESIKENGVLQASSCNEIPSITACKRASSADASKSPRATCMGQPFWLKQTNAASTNFSSSGMSQHRCSISERIETT